MALIIFSLCTLYRLNQLVNVKHQLSKLWNFFDRSIIFVQMRVHRYYHGMPFEQPMGRVTFNTLQYHQYPHVTKCCPSSNFQKLGLMFPSNFRSFQKVGFPYSPPLRIQRCFRHGSPPHATGPQGPNDLHVRWSQPPGADGRFLEMGDLQVTMVVSLHIINNGLI